jgi:hypothetical protein
MTNLWMLIFKSSTERKRQRVRRSCGSKHHRKGTRYLICEGISTIFSREGDHMCRLIFAAVTLITIHTLCKDLATAEVSTHVKAYLVPSRSFAISRPREPASGASTFRRVHC